MQRLPFKLPIQKQEACKISHPKEGEININNKEFNPLNNIIIGEKNQYNIIDQHNILERNFTTRRNHSFYISTNIYESWKRYCQLIGGKAHKHLETALIEYTKNNQPDGIPLNFTQDLRNFTSSFKIETKLVLYKNQLREDLERVKKTPSRDFKKLLMRSTNRALNLNANDEELNSLITESRRFFE